MKPTKLLVLAAATLAFAGCNNNVTTPKYLVLYYSQTGGTEQVAQEFASQLGIEAVSFDAAEPYDGSYEETIQRVGQEREARIFPALNPLSVNLEDYDVIFLGYPIWYGTYAPPVTTLLLQNDFSGKTIVPFCTFGSGGLESSVNDLRNACPDATVTDGYGVRAARLDKISGEVTAFLTAAGYLEGEVAEAGEYGEAHETTEEEAAIFEAACGSYPMPLGAPSTVCTRENGDGSTDYIFITAGTTPDGQEFTSSIYVSCVEGAEPDFVKVVR